MPKPVPRPSMNEYRADKLRNLLVELVDEAPACSLDRDADIAEAIASGTPVRSSLLQLSESPGSADVAR